MSYQSGFRPNLFEGKKIVVTGGGSGLGRCNAHELASLGAELALVGRRIEKLEKVQQELADAGGRAEIFSCDLRQEQPVKETVAAILEKLGGIDGLVNNAGGQFPAQLKDISFNGWSAVVNNNMTATFLMSREVYLQWMETHGGAIVNIGADYERGMAGMGHSGAARAGQANFTKTASVEWAHSGVRVNHLIPGFIASSGLDEYPASSADTLRKVKSRIPLKRHGTESEISAAIVFLLSEMAAYINGATLQVDGGLHHAASVFYEIPDHDNSPPYNGFPLYKRPDVLGE
ncbi:MAG: SDR family oxidoreductase [Pseudomonadota bacterium]